MIEMKFKVTGYYGMEYLLELIPAPQERFCRVFIWDLEGDGRANRYIIDIKESDDA